MLAAAFSCAGVRLSAQERESALSDAEIEKLRDTAAYPPQRVLAFVTFLDDRALEITKLVAGKRQPGREEDVHDRMVQLTSVADDLEDNLDDYARRHQDVRSVLKKLVAATERWATAVKTPGEHEAYGVARTLALEAIADVHESAVKLIEEQRTYFLAHPPSKEEQAPSRR